MRCVRASGCSVILSLLVKVTASGAAPDDGSVLLFPPTPMAGAAKPRLQNTTMKFRRVPRKSRKRSWPDHF
jgi:hypothetical protein